MIELTNVWDILCNWNILCNICILTMEQLSRMMGVSYGFLNILLFVVLGPMSTLFFAAATASAMWMEGKVRKEV